MDKETFLNIKNNFQNNYFKHIKPKLDKFEEKRITARKQFYFIVLPICIIITIILLITILNLISKRTIDCDLLFTILIPISICTIVYKTLEKSLENEMKKDFMPNICKCFENLNWKNEVYTTPEIFKEIGLVDNYNESEFDDIFYGNYKNTDFEIIESRLIHVSRSSKHKSQRTIFRGIILKITTTKNFDSHTIIRPDNIIKFPIKNLKRTELEDVVFEKKYDVFTNNEIEARVIITPSFMERLNNIEKVFNSKKTSCCFIGNTTYIGLHTGKDMFKLCSLEKSVGAEYFSKMFEEMISIYRLIEHLKLTQTQIHS